MLECLTRKMPKVLFPSIQHQHSINPFSVRIRGEIIIILRFERRVCRWESCRMRHFSEVDSGWWIVDGEKLLWLFSAYHQLSTINFSPTAALVQPQETLRSERRGWGWKS